MKVVFLDRDGVINADRDDYVKSVDELIVFDYVPESVKKLNDAGFETIVISNQQCVAKGLIGMSDVFDIQKEILKIVELSGGKITDFFYCPHNITQDCNCRKPKPGMLIMASEKYEIDFEKSYMVGDNAKDIKAANSAGCKGILVLTGMSTMKDAESMNPKPVYVAENLADAVDFIVGIGD